MSHRGVVSHREVLEAELGEFQIELPPVQKLTLARYCDELAHWNKRINLTGLWGADMVRRLVVEPVWTGLQLKPSGVLADIGSGNGSPAIPLHVVRGFNTCHLIEARTKRAAFLRNVTTTLKLPEIKVHLGRFEEVAQILGSPDWITLQAVALTDELLDSIRLISSSTTKIVWITAQGVETELLPMKTLTIPITGTQVLLFQLDLS